MLAKLLRLALLALVGLYALLLGLVLTHQRISAPRPAGPAGQPDLARLAQRLHPHLAELAVLPYFRYFRVSLGQPCAFSFEGEVCRSQTTCELASQAARAALPAAFLEEDARTLARNAEFSNYAQFEFVRPFFDAREPPWSFDALRPDSIYVDLVADREQYTGYQGQAVWEKIYRENCLGFSRQCNDSQALYRLVSGMHSSVSSHICEYFIDWRRNETLADPQLYFARVGAWPERLANLFFAWEVLAQALLRYRDPIARMPLKTGDLRADLRVRAGLERVWQALGEYPERELRVADFGDEAGRPGTRELFLRYFTNITRLMDCVECVKCKVYGKLQVLGLGTALRVLLNPAPGELTRNELVALLNTLNKWTEAVVILGRMQRRTALRRAKQALLLTALFCLLLIPLLLALSRARAKRKTS